MPSFTFSSSRSRSPRPPAPARWIDSGLLVLQSVLALSTCYLLALLLAARRASEGPLERSLEDVEAERGGPPGENARAAGAPLLLVLIPAHNEESGIATTLRSLSACRYPQTARRIVVIADNCSDRTAERAREQDVEVWERADQDARGKGHALGWALTRALADPGSCDAVVMLDADCLVSPNLLIALAARLRGGAGALQVNYLAANPESSNASALRFAGLALMNYVRFLGKQHLGLSCGLVGSGMAFSRELLEREPWQATGLTEDAEYHLRLVLAGERAEFAPEAWISSAMPTSLGSTSEERWEQGKLQLIRDWSPRLLRAGLGRRDLVRLHAGLECLVPPQSLIGAGSTMSALAGLVLRSRRLASLSLLTLLAQLAFVVVGLRLVRAPARVYRALLFAPVLATNKAMLYTRLLRGRGPTAWVRTEREGLA